MSTFILAHIGRARQVTYMRVEKEKRRMAIGAAGNRSKYLKSLEHFKLRKKFLALPVGVLGVDGLGRTG